MLLPLPPAVLVGGAGGGGGAYARAPRGFFIGGDAGGAVMVGAGADAAHGAFAFGAHAGYQWASGLSLQLRFDDLGVSPPDGSGPLLLGTVGARYSLPLVLMPFAEALVGPAFHGSQVTPAAGLGLGVSLPVLRHLAFDLSVRDWIAGLDGAVRNVPTAELGITVGFTGR
jgi:hypothetical protein